MLRNRARLGMRRGRSLVGGRECRPLSRYSSKMRRHITCASIRPPSGIQPENRNHLVWFSIMSLRFLLSRRASFVDVVTNVEISFPGLCSCLIYGAPSLQPFLFHKHDKSGAIGARPEASLGWWLWTGNKTVNSTRGDPGTLVCWELP